MVSSPIGIVADKIIDNISIFLKMNREDEKVKGIIGTTIYENKIIQ